MTNVCALTPNSKNSCLDAVAQEVLKDVKENSIEEFKANNKCETDECVLEKAVKDEELVEKIKATVFKVPTKSFDHNYWMNNTEIDTVMMQMRCHFPGFAHSFIHMIDLKSFPPSNLNLFDYPVLPLNEINFAKGLSLGISKSKPEKLSTYNDTPLHSFGVVCNTDSSKGTGQHWFSVFVSTDHKDPSDTTKPWIKIELFNSAGGKPSNPTFNKFWETQAFEISKATGCKCTYDEVTNIQHQSPDTGNCGSYSLFYIFARLQKVDPTEFNRPGNIVTDKKMREFREVCFRVTDLPNAQSMF